MKSNIKSLAIFSLALILLASCNRFEVESLEITSPTGAQEYDHGHKFSLEAKADGSGIEKYDVVITNTSNNDEVVFSESGDIEDLPFTYSGEWTNDVSDHADMIMTFTVMGGDEEDSESTDIAFHCHPMGHGDHDGHDHGGM